jgi:hypothetical protein
VLANAARHEPEAVAALARGARGAKRAGLSRVFRIPPPQPYRAPGARQAPWGRVR